MTEKRIQREYIMKFLCRREEEGGLGYRETSPNIVSPDLFIPSQMAEFVRRSNPLVWKSLMSRYRNDEKALQNDLKDKVKELLLKSSNTATFLHNTRNFSLQGETVPLFFVSGTELRGDVDFERNIFSAVEEMSHNIVSDGITLMTIRPDISFFVNGIFFGYLELKSITNGQNAATNGRGKIIGDFLESVDLMTRREKTNAEGVNADRKMTLQIFEKAIHLVATDVNETYVMRGLTGFYEEARRGFADGTMSISMMRPEIMKAFKIYPVSSPLLSQTERFEEVMRAIYGKKMVEREILYYNFIKYTYKEAKVNGQRVRATNRGVLISPRPKQKFGCDKIMCRVAEMLSNEKDPDFYLRRLRRELEALGVDAETTDRIVRQNDSLCNNKYVYSLLLQYAAGFGKSNIIGWTALQLKDLRHDGRWAYDKILIVVDRLQLRDQIDEMMYNMNIDKSMFVEAVDQKTLIDALSPTGESRRIIVVNIQKFLDLQNALHRSGKKLEKMRVAFLIDEIHRSNTGENNRDMLNVFEQLQDALCAEAEAAGAAGRKRNLIIGFTATPSDKVLARFGEYKSDPKQIPLWVPFDSYTMKEAIEDGYILDPTKHIIPVESKLRFELPEGVDPDNDSCKLTIEKEKIYSNPERMQRIAQFIVGRLVSLVYGKIRGTGKAMLAVSSIPNAISYCRLIRKLMEEKCSDKKYERYKDAPIAVVYSDNQDYESSQSMNGGKKEEKVISEFKKAKNGLIIVVDKLQTGFDEPKLHTLFLDKEISDINAIQTISRVNRKCKYKEECHIIDLSWRKVNVTNIAEAYKKFCGTVVSEFNPLAEEKVLETLYDDLKQSEPSARWFAEFCQHYNEVLFIMQFEEWLRRWITRQFEMAAKADAENPDREVEAHNEAKRLRRVVGQYGSILMMLEDVFEVDGRFKDPAFLKFWEIYCNVYRALMAGRNDSGVVHPDVNASDEIPGITISELSGEEESRDEDDGKDGDGEGDGSHGGNPKQQSLIEMLKLINEREQLTAEEIQKWQEEIDRLFDYLKTDGRFMALLRDKTFSDEKKSDEYMTVLKRYRRGLSNRQDDDKVRQLKKLLTENADQLYDMFLGDNI